MKVLFIQLFLFTIFSFSSFSQLKKDIIDPGAKLEIIADTFQFTEGPSSDMHGNIYFTDIKTSRIYIWTIDRKLSIFREPSGRANGLKFDRRTGLLFVCEGASRSVTTISPEGKHTELITQFEDKKLNSPNDLWIDPQGGIYFTDPRYDARWIWIEKNDTNIYNTKNIYPEEQDYRALYYLPRDGKPLRRVANGFMNPNGIVGTKDGTKLYVSDTEKKEIYLFDIMGDGSLSNRRIFISQYSDGMTLDELNNLYITNGGIHIYNPEGNLISTIELPSKSSNVCFGGSDHKTLLITARKTVFSLRTKITGQ